ncbi:hypothetical protein ACIGNX_00065 [Actinosynnema sp. NPDC053489]|uniref:hypothetical protein n=1 Tax=Actinosynnema sp. NPDC053489 TaxID=3363916 RepID=UPI0037CAB507
MPYLTIDPRAVLTKLVEWIDAEEPVIEEVFRFSGDWDAWAHHQFARWLQRDLRPPDGVDPLDVVTRIGRLWTGDAVTPVFRQDPTVPADLVFNLGAAADDAPPLVVVQLRCDASARTWHDYVADLGADVARLRGISPDLVPPPRRRGTAAVAVGVHRVDAHRVVAPGFAATFAGRRHVVQWWADFPSWERLRTS